MRLSEVLLHEINPDGSSAHLRYKTAQFLAADVLNATRLSLTPEQMQQRYNQAVDYFLNDAHLPPDSDQVAPYQD